MDAVVTLRIDRAARRVVIENSDSKAFYVGANFLGVCLLRGRRNYSVADARTLGGVKKGGTISNRAGHCKLNTQVGFVGKRRGTYSTLTHFQTN